MLQSQFAVCHQIFPSVINEQWGLALYHTSGFPHQTEAAGLIQKLGLFEVVLCLLLVVLSLFVLVLRLFIVILCLFGAVVLAYFASLCSNLASLVVVRLLVDR